MLESLVKDQFIDLLTDEDMKLRIRQNRPESLQQALEAALELESYQLASRHRAIPACSAQLDWLYTVKVTEKDQALRSES